MGSSRHFVCVTAPSWHLAHAFSCALCLSLHFARVPYSRAIPCASRLRGIPCAFVFHLVHGPHVRAIQCTLHLTRHPVPFRSYNVLRDFPYSPHLFASFRSRYTLSQHPTHPPPSSLAPLRHAFSHATIQPKSNGGISPQILRRKMFKNDTIYPNYCLNVYYFGLIGLDVEGGDGRCFTNNDTEMSPSQIAYARARNKPCTILYPFLAVLFFFHNTPAHIPISYDGVPRRGRFGHGIIYLHPLVPQKAGFRHGSQGLTSPVPQEGLFGHGITKLPSTVSPGGRFGHVTSVFSLPVPQGQCHRHEGNRHSAPVPRSGRFRHGGQHLTSPVPQKAGFGHGTIDLISSVPQDDSFGHGGTFCFFVHAFRRMRLAQSILRWPARASECPAWARHHHFLLGRAQDATFLARSNYFHTDRDRKSATGARAHGSAHKFLVVIARQKAETVPTPQIGRGLSCGESGHWKSANRNAGFSPDPAVEPKRAA